MDTWVDTVLSSCLCILNPLYITQTVCLCDILIHSPIKSSLLMQICKNGSHCILRGVCPSRLFWIREHLLPYLGISLHDSEESTQICSSRNAGTSSWSWAVDKVEEGVWSTPHIQSSLITPSFLHFVPPVYPGQLASQEPSP